MAAPDLSNPITLQELRRSWWVLAVGRAVLCGAQPVVVSRGLKRTVEISAANAVSSCKLLRYLLEYRGFLGRRRRTPEGYQSSCVPGGNFWDAAIEGLARWSPRRPRGIISRSIPHPPRMGDSSCAAISARWFAVVFRFPM